MIRPNLVLRSLALTAALSWAPLSAPAQSRPIVLSPAQIGDLWRLHWPRYASRYVTLEGGDYAPCAKYSRRYPSSRHVSTQKVKDSTRKTKKQRTRVGSTSLERRTSVRTSDADARVYARALPAMSVGEYGFISGCTVTEVLGPGAMLVADVLLIDPDDEPEPVDEAKAEHAAEAETR